MKQMILKKGVIMTVENNAGYDPDAKMFFVLKEEGNGPSAVVTHSAGVDFSTAVNWMQEMNRTGGAHVIAVDVCLELCRLTSDEVAKLAAILQRRHHPRAA